MRYFKHLVDQIKKAELIIDMILAENNISYECLRSKGVKGEQAAADARHEVAYCLRELLKFKENEVAYILGYTNRLSVLYAKKKVNRLMSVDKNYRAKIEKMKVHVDSVKEFNRLSDLF